MLKPQMQVHFALAVSGLLAAEMPSHQSFARLTPRRIELGEQTCLV